MPISAELKGCVTLFLYISNLLKVKYNCAKFHHFRICLTDFKERFWQILLCHSHPWAALKRSMMNRVMSFNVKHLRKSYYWKKMIFSKLRFSKLKKFVFRSVFGEFQHADINEFWNFLLQVKYQRSGSKSLGGFSFLLILKGIIMF